MATWFVSAFVAIGLLCMTLLTWLDASKSAHVSFPLVLVDCRGAPQQYIDSSPYGWSENGTRYRCVTESRDFGIALKGYLFYSDAIIGGQK